jgi:hypothetical protein
MAQASKKTLAMSILSGALAGMAAGFGTSTEPQIAKASDADIDAFAKKTGTTQKNAQAGAQEEADANQLRAYTTMDHNLKIHADQIRVQQLQGDLLDKNADAGQAFDKALQLAPPVQVNGVDTDVVQVQDVGPAEVQKLLSTTNPDGTKKDPSLQVTRDSVIATGSRFVYDSEGKQQFNNDGTPKKEQTFTVYNHSAEVALTDELRKQFPGKFDDVAVGTAVPARVISKYLREASEQRTAAQAVSMHIGGYNDANKGNEIDTKFDLAAAAKKDPRIKSLYGALAKYGTEDVDLMFKDLRTAAAKGEVDGGAVNAFQAAVGITDKGLEKQKIARLTAEQQPKTDEAVQKTLAEASAKRATPEGQAEILHKNLENQQLQQNLAQAESQGKGLEVPANFVANDKANEMPIDDLQKDLSGKGVNLPANFSALYAIGHNSADLATLPTTPRKGVNVMPRDQALSFIRTYINPSYNEGDYAAAKKLNTEIASTRQGTAGGSLLSAGVASQHLAMLEQASIALQNNDLPALNHILNTMGQATGTDKKVVFNAIAEQVNSEVAKVVAGGVPGEQELAANRKTLNSDQSPAQVKGVVNKYIGLMNGRIGEIDDRSMQYFGRHVKGLSPETARVFVQHGYTVPGQPTEAKAIGNIKGVPYWADANGKPLKDAKGQFIKVGQ